MTKDHSSRHKHRHHLISEDGTVRSKYSTSPGLDDYYKRKSKHKHRHKSSTYHSENHDPDHSPIGNNVIEVHDSASDEDDDRGSIKRSKHHSKDSMCVRSYDKKHRKRHKSRSRSSSEEDEAERGDHDRHDRNSSRRKDRSRRNVPDESVDRDRKRKDPEEGSSRNKKLKTEEIRIKQEPIDENDVDTERIEIKREPKIEPETDKTRDPIGRRHRIKEEPRDIRSRSRNDRQGPSGSRNQPRRDRPQDQERDVHEWGGGRQDNKDNEKKPKTEQEKPNFKLSGKLAEDTNVYKGVVIKYSEPPEARMPKKRWRLYPFKGEEAMPTLYIHRQSAYLLGRDRKIADIPIDHPSCSKQHAVLQYRLITYERPDGSVGKQIRLYIIDLESANGTFLNNNKIEPKKYVELREKDVLKFGFSSREYVLLHEHSKGDVSEEEQ